MISFIRLKSHLLKSLERMTLELLDLLSEHLCRGRCRVDTARLDGDDDMPIVLEETLSVMDDYTGLIGLSYIREDDVYC